MDELFPLFSKPVFKKWFDVGDIDISDLEWYANDDNITSRDTNVLDNPKYEKLKEIATEMSKTYFYNLLGVYPSVDLYITSSWFNKTTQGQSHHKHFHPNSVLSGILYIDGDNFITAFESDPSSDFDFDKQPNMWNSNQCYLSFTKGDCVVFKSNTPHFVPKYEGVTHRITLSWNTFVRGNISTNPTAKLTI